MAELAALADKYGNGEIRLTTAQNAILANVPDERVEPLLREPLLRELSPTPSPFFRGMVACTGTDFCNLAQIQTKKLAIELSTALEERFGADGSPFTINWSGCPAGCGNHQAADIGFRGMKVNVGDKIIEAVAIYTGGRTGPGATAGEQIIDMVPCDGSLADVVAALVSKLGLLDRRLPRQPDFVPLGVLVPPPLGPVQASVGGD